ncbi:hypothetical protein IGI04_039314 [Brassica rapa subsp. trilocularis]|uniref:Uncharacterized protein n=4 Tax=Brassica TaxID=3705 RepID=M4EX54_BRACM|nr:DNA ligase 1 [Brassica napus]KAG5374718.1 hypothetical protein IGI04_039314 [Brassica rapa subsp. trilocularis]KAH0905482.1 hypothetical protein HID58_037309 [Brassica napus]CAF2309168.1 unnamed protein product [Brassica napus]
MNNGSSPKSQDKSQKMKKSMKLNEDSDKETVEHKQVPEDENPKTDAKEEKGSQGASDKKDKKEKVPENENPKTEAKEDKGSQEASDKKDKKEKGVGCCKKCKAKAKMTKKKLKEEASDEEDEKQKQKTEKGSQKTDTNEEKGTKGTSDVKDKKETSMITWRHKSTKKDKSHGKNLCSVNPPYQTGRSMYHGRPNFSNPWNMYAPPRVLYPAFAKGPMYGQCGGGGGGPLQPYQSMNPAAAMYRGAIMSPYPPMAAAMYPPYWQSRPFTDANPITRYTTYRDNYTTHRNNYSYFFI